MKWKITCLIVMALAVFALAGCSGPTGESVADTTGDAPSEEEGTSGEKVTVYFFWGEGCPHCATEKPFLEELENKYPEVEVKMFETYNDPENVQKFQKVAQAYGTNARGVPATFIGEEYWEGYSESIGEEIEAKIKDCIENDCPNPQDKLE
ncbi:MAG: TlpA family protein disulfide reductase [Candidatus Nanoarchaeia archaeon]